MDGLNVNSAALNELEPSLKQSTVQILQLLLILEHADYTLLTTATNGFKSVDWMIIEFLRSAYYLMKDVPARRSDNLRFSIPENPPFPKKFCSMRWLENVEVSETALRIIPNFKQFVDGVAKEKLKFRRRVSNS